MMQGRISTYEQAAADRMDPAAFAYVAGGAGAEVTVRFSEPGGGRVLAMAPETPAAPDRLVVRLPAIMPPTGC